MLKVKIYLIIIFILMFTTVIALSEDSTIDIELTVFTRDDYILSVTIFDIDGLVLERYKENFEATFNYPILTVLNNGAYYLIEVNTPNSEYGIELEYYLPETKQGFVAYGKNGYVNIIMVDYKIIRRKNK